ncbi:chloride channel protein C-like [Saccoglossus kowalevskii]|uniref:Chloride channel protein n=1 Tax=Saccoglossus kowalevskii TaxID=10224 RepID=A0ABM0GX69_SACKO|nr:PREDICTED: chloride channel protein D-like [Saccoglossus kowalevskii]
MTANHDSSNGTHPFRMKRLEETEVEEGVRYRPAPQSPPDSVSNETTESAETTGFFARGRDYESAYINHHYSKAERELLGTYESLDYLPPHSQAYKNWLRKQPARLDWDRWVMMGMIGFIVGIIGFLIHQCIDVISDFKWDRAEELIQDDEIMKAWGFVLIYSLGFVLLASLPVVYLRPSATGSGIPELIGYLNGTMVGKIFNVKTLVVKIWSCICAVGSGMPVGPEGPMIHIGSLVGAGLSQFKSDTLGFKLPYFTRFRNSEDRRNFISAGAAAGVASAFGAPVGGLLFSMEEVSSFWNLKLSWMTFFCCIISTFTTDLFDSAFSGFQYTGYFGMFSAEKNIMFQVRKGLDVNLWLFIPTVILGIIGGLLGALFVFINLKLARLRRLVMRKLAKIWKQNIAKWIEPCIIMIIFATLTVFLPALFSCSPFTCYLQGEKVSPDTYSPNCLTTPTEIEPEPTVSIYNCEPGVKFKNETSQWSNASYSELATLMFVTGEEAISHLFSRETHLEFNYPSLLTMLVVYYPLSCWTAGTAMSTGLVVPMLLIGALYGRIIGLIMVSIFGVQTEENPYWAWMDPGALALIGSASFFGGVSRLTMSLSVIMMEITNDIQFLLPIMVAIVVSKWVGDFFTHPIYHALLEFKCIPFLDHEPIIYDEHNKAVNLELHYARDAMVSPVLVLHTRETVHKLASLLRDTKHGGFPIVKSDENGDRRFLGLITRTELCVLLKQEDLFEAVEEPSDDAPELTPLEYQELIVDKIPIGMEDVLDELCNNEQNQNLYLNLAPYYNQSASCVHENFSLHRTYIIYRTMGLRHLTVVDRHNQVVGFLTRKDLMGFQLEETMARLDLQNQDMGAANVELSSMDA